MATTNFAELLAPIYAKLNQIIRLTEPFGRDIESQTYDNIKNVCLCLPEEETDHAIKALLTAIDKVEEILTTVTEGGYVALMDKTVLNEATQAFIFMATGGANLPVDDDKTKKMIDLISAMYANELKSCIKKLSGYVEEIQKYSNPKSNNENSTVEIHGEITFDKLKTINKPIKYNANQAALLLYFLKREKHIQPYSDLALGKIGEKLFGFEPESLRQHICNVKKFDKVVVQDDLKALRSLLKELLAEINKEIMP